MKYNFDEMIDRQNTNCMSTDGFRAYIFHDPEGKMKFPYKDDEFIRMWIADMEFATPEFILDAMRARLNRRILGYTKVFDPAYYEAFKNWTDKKYGWHCQNQHRHGNLPRPYGYHKLFLRGDRRHHRYFHLHGH